MTPAEQGRMTPENFCYWLQGFVELSAEPPTPEQWASIAEHLQLVFKKVTGPVIKVDGGESARKALEKALERAIKRPAVDPSYSVPSLVDLVRRANDSTHPYHSGGPLGPITC